MNATHKYTDGKVVPLPTMEEPKKEDHAVPHKGSLVFMDWASARTYIDLVALYKQHLADCQRNAIPVTGQHNWTEGQVVTEGKDFRTEDVLCQIVGDAWGQGYTQTVAVPAAQEGEGNSENINELATLILKAPAIGDDAVGAAWTWIAKNGKRMYDIENGDGWTAHSVLIALYKVANALTLKK